MGLEFYIDDDCNSQPCYPICPPEPITRNSGELVPIGGDQYGMYVIPAGVLSYSFSVRKGVVKWRIGSTGAWMELWPGDGDSWTDPRNDSIASHVSIQKIEIDATKGLVWGKYQNP